MSTDYPKEKQTTGSSTASNIIDDPVRQVDSGLFLQIQVRVLEGLFGADWFQGDSYKVTTHLAYRRWKYCSELIKRGGSIPRLVFMLGEPEP